MKMTNMDVAKMTDQERKDKGIVLIKGGYYLKVSGRVLEIHAKYPDGVSITSEILDETESYITVKAVVEVNNGNSVSRTSGHARAYFEFKNKNSVNFSFALENAETSAIGRAIGTAGVGLIEGSGFASAFEMERIEAKNKARESQIQNQESKDEPVQPRLHADGEDKKTEIEQLRTQVKDLREKLNWQTDDLMALAKERYPGLEEWKNLKTTQFKWLVWKLKSELKKAQ